MAAQPDMDTILTLYPWDPAEVPHPPSELSDGQRAAGIRLAFSKKPKGSRGYLLGADVQQCDVVLPGDLVSAVHCVITCKPAGQGRFHLVLADCSSQGTKVAFDGQLANELYRKDHVWTLHANYTDQFRNIVVEVGGAAYRVEINPYIDSLPFQQRMAFFLLDLAQAATWDAPP